MNESSQKNDAFLSYNSLDHAIVERVARELGARQCKCFIDRWYLEPGVSWLDALEGALSSSKSAAIFIGPHGMGRWQQREREWLQNREVEVAKFRFIPVLLPGCEPPVGFMKNFMWIDLRDDPADPVQLDALAAAIRGETVNREGRPEPRAMICPYRGLLAFREEDADFFFGRQKYTDDLVKLVAQQSIVAVTGASGSGKSSVVRAGLVPQLRKHSEGPVWDILTMVPKVNPLHSLAEVFLPLVEPELSGIDLLVKCKEMAEHLEHSRLHLWQLASSGLEKQKGTSRLLLVVDQWEELYTNCKNDNQRNRFIQELLDATSRAGSQLSVVFTVRWDFYGHILQNRPLLDRLKQSRLDLGPMDRVELRSAIEGPGSKVGLTFQDGLVERILYEAGQEPGRLALLEFALEGLWENRNRGELTHAGYEALGQQPGRKSQDSTTAKTNCLSRAIATYADAVYDQLRPEEQKALPQLFRRLVRAGSKAEEDTRRRALISDLSETSQSLVRTLADKRLLITTLSGSEERSAEKPDSRHTEESSGKDAVLRPPEPVRMTVEVAHEELLRRWGRLKVWVNKDRDFLQWASRLDLKLEEFQRDGDSALLRGKALHSAKEFYPAREADLEGSQQDFLRASLDAAWRRKWHQWGTGSLAGIIAASLWFWLQTIYRVDNLLATPASTVDFYLARLDWDPYAYLAIPRLRETFSNADGTHKQSQQLHAAYALFRLNVAGPDELQYLLDSIPVSTLPKEEGPNLIAALEMWHAQKPIDQTLKERIDQAKSESEKHRYLSVALGLSVTTEASAICALTADPTPRTSFILGFRDFPGDLKRIARLLETTEDMALRSALCLAIGRIGPDAAEDTGDVLRRLYAEAPDGGTHSATEWALRQQGFTNPDFDALLGTPPQPMENSDWSFIRFKGQMMTMLRIPEHDFAMGPVDDEVDPWVGAKVKTFKTFWLSDREVSVGQFMAFVGATDNKIQWAGEDKDFSPTLQHPVQQVSWYDVIEYCNWLSGEEGLTPCYEHTTELDGPEGQTERVWRRNQEANGYRLPTEEEWEYACRALSTTNYAFGDDWSMIKEHVVYNEETTDVCGSRLPNPWGLFDMHGNVLEWCWDDPTTGGFSRVLRGGSFGNVFPQDLRSANRHDQVQELRNYLIGFRIFRTP